MRRHLFVVLSALVLLGCGGGITENRINNPNDRIGDWRVEEAACPDIETECRITYNFVRDLNRVLNQIVSAREWTYDASDGTYWQPSCESLATERGACKDMAILAGRTVVDSCLSEYYDIDVNIRRYKISALTRHVVTIIYYHNKSTQSDEVYEVNNLELQLVPSSLPIVLEVPFYMG